MTSEPTIEISSKKSKKEKKVKKEKKRKLEDVEEESSKKLSKEDRKKLKAQKKAEKEEALAKVPKTDEHGIAYTKIQIKRMVKRVKRGLPPVPTEEEEKERIKKLKAEERETQDELAGMIFKRDNEVEKDDAEDGDTDNDNDEDDVDVDVEKDVGGAGEDGDKDGNGDDEDKNTETQEDIQNNIKEPMKKKPRSKPVPSDYVCFACKNTHSPLHWIYDCPNKIHKPGTNQVKKKLRGINDPSSRKVFVSGLPFDCKSKDVELYFEKEMKCGKVVHCKLLVFEDTKRCKGNGFLTFESDEGAKKALKLNGTTFSLGKEDKKAGNKKTKELRLGVKKVLNRTQTKR